MVRAALRRPRTDEPAEEARVEALGAIQRAKDAATMPSTVREEAERRAEQFTRMREQQRRSDAAAEEARRADRADVDKRIAANVRAAGEVEREHERHMRSAEERALLARLRAARAPTFARLAGDAIETSAKALRDASLAPRRRQRVRQRPPTTGRQKTRALAAASRHAFDSTTCAAHSGCAAPADFQ